MQRPDTLIASSTLLVLLLLLLLLLLSLLVTPIDFSANSASRKLMAAGKTLQIRQG